MFLTITSVVVAALFGMAAIIALRFSVVNDSLRCKIKRMSDEAEKHRQQVKLLKADNLRLCDTHQSENVTYFAVAKEGKAAVFRRCFVNGYEYHTFIKEFTDEDAGFNLREAEELCDELNS